MTPPNDPAVRRSSVVNGRIWVASFAVATALGIAVAYQAWASHRGPNRALSFWDHRIIEPQLIPWLVWAAFAPLLMQIFERADGRGTRLSLRLTLYTMLGVGAVVLHATVSGLALGWWWSFPSLIPLDPAWHIRDLLQTRTVVSLLVFALIAAIYHARASRIVAPTAVVPRPMGPPARPAQSPIALKTSDRIVFVQPQQISWIQADGDYVVVHVGSARHRVRDTISALETRLASSQLIRVSRSAIVNVSAITEMQPWFRGNFMIILRDGSRVPTGNKYRDRITRLI